MEFLASVKNVRREQSSLKLPQLWATEPQIWFAQDEAQFALRKIVSDDTKYYYILSSLNQTITSRLKDFISHPPDKYSLHIRTISPSHFAHLNYRIHGQIVNSDTLLTFRSSPPISYMFSTSKIMWWTHCPGPQ